MKIFFIVDITLKLIPMYFLLTKLEDFVQKHFSSSRNGQVLKCHKNYIRKVGHIYRHYRRDTLRLNNNYMKI